MVLVIIVITLCIWKLIQLMYAVYFILHFHSLRRCETKKG